MNKTLQCLSILKILIWSCTRLNMGLNQQWVQHRDEDIITVKNPNITINVIHNGPRSCDCMLIFEALLGNNQQFRE